jgi:phage terminase large subunit-like protein
MKLCNKFQPFFEILDDSLIDEAGLHIHDNIRYVILIGGRGGAKSFALSAWINQASYKENYGILFTRYTMTSAETSIIPEFRNLCENLNNVNDFSFSRTHVVNNYSNCPITYKGLKPTSNQSTGALKSVANKNVFILEEAEDCPNFELFDKVDNSIRTKTAKNIVVLCLNQGHINHWIFKEFFNSKRDDVMIIETTYLDNLEFLDDSFIKKAERVKDRDLGRYNHIYLNEWKSDVDGALWLDSDISPYRISIDEYKSKKANGEIKRTVIGYDPAVTDTDKIKSMQTNQTGKLPDEDGIVICSEDINKHCYVIRDNSCRGKRSEVSQLLVNLYFKYEAEAIIIEKNNGGDFIPALIKTCENGRFVKCETVTATKGKRLRAQPIQAIYEQGEIHHIGHLAELELEMTTWTGDVSPNRLDALVWALIWLIIPPQITKPVQVTGLRF